MGLPFYHAGIRISYVLDEQLTLSIWGVNGWNTIVDQNDEKSIILQLAWSIPELDLGVLYMTGVERPGGAPEGRAWRHLFDLHATVHLLDGMLHLRALFEGGFEPNDFGTSGWLAGGAYVRVIPIPELRITARGDFFWEEIASNARGTASALFWPTEWVSSQTLTVEARPVEGVAFYLEYRHDHAASPAFFRGAVAGDGTTVPFVANAESQDTITIGTSAWLD